MSLNDRICELLLSLRGEKQVWDKLSSIATWDFIQNNPSERWNWEKISKNPNITLDIIENNPNKKWYWEEISKNPNLTYDFVKKNIRKSGWWWYRVSRNPGIKWEDITNNPNERWIWEYVSENPNITPEIVKNNPNVKWYYDSLSKILDFDFVLENLDKNWNWEEITKRFGNIATVSKYPNLKWDWEIISKNPNITYEFVIRNYFYKSWDCDALSGNPGIKLKNVVSQLPRETSYDSFDERIFTFKGILLHPELTFEMMKELPFHNYEIYSSNPNVTIEIIKNNLQKDWNILKLIQNPSLSYKDIEKNFKIWGWGEYLVKEFCEKKWDSIIKETEFWAKKEWIAVKKIKRWWRICKN